MAELTGGPPAFFDRLNGSVVDLALNEDATPISAIRRMPGSLESDRIFRFLSIASAVVVLLMFVGIMVALTYGAWPAIQAFGFSFLWTQIWNPVTQKFGAVVPI
jgi:phosphate transport system permease protein